MFMIIPDSSITEEDQGGRTSSSRAVTSRPLLVVKLVSRLLSCEILGDRCDSNLTLPQREDFQSSECLLLDFTIRESGLIQKKKKQLELRFQNHQLARTLLDLNMKMQQLKKQQDLERASKPQGPEDNSMNPECGNA
ncbi:hypothetical protein STEG23_016624 [Scotinomys teguina]